MQVLGNQNYSLQPNYPTIRQSQPDQSSPSQPATMQQQICTLSQKKKPIRPKSKQSLEANYPIQEFKQNNHKQKASSRLEQLSNRTSNKHLHMMPFSSVVNTKVNTKNCDLIKSNQKPYESHNGHVNKKNQHLVQPKHDSRKEIEKIIENKLNQIIENKRKSISYRIHGPPKDTNIYKQVRKQSHHIQQTSTHHIQEIQQKVQKQAPKSLIVNKQKSSQSFIIRKKINSNAVQTQRNQKPDKFPTNYIKDLQKEKFINSHNSKNQHQTKTNDSNNNSQSHTLSKYAYKPMEQQLKKLKQRKVDKQVSMKPQHIKGIKCLKVRVNKVLKAQEQLFNEKSFAEEKSQIVQKEQNNKAEQNENQHSFYDQRKNQQQYETPKRLITIEQVIEDSKREQKYQQNQEVSYQKQNESANNSNIHQTQQVMKNNSQYPKVDMKVQQSELKQSRGQVKWKSYKQTEQTLNIKNRKNRISSIRAIKNYYKKMETQDKSSLITDEKQIKQITTIKKKQKQPPCLTHKIKWGNSSKKKLNSDRGLFDALINQIQEFSVDYKNQVKKQTGFKAQNQQCSNENNAKTTIQAKLTVPTAKKKTMQRVQFLEDQTGRFNQYQKTTPKANKNLQKIFAQTINSKEFIDYDAIPYSAGSKSLIMFEDPGISMIANNNSIHAPSYPIGLTTIERPSQQFMNIEGNDISPVAIMKRRPYNVVEQKDQQQQNPLQSLQELYFELKSHKSIRMKANDEYKMESLQELCEG